MPLFGSLNAVSPGKWASYARQLEDTGIQGLELNLYAVQTDPARPAADIEKEHLDIVGSVIDSVKIPVAVKLSPYYTSVANVAAEMDRRGAKGLVLFNRFLQPDIDTQAEGLVGRLEGSHPSELKLPLRWTAILFGRIKADLAVSTGVHYPEGAIKALLAGATIVQVVSALYHNGIEHLTKIVDGVAKWMDDKGYGRVSDFRGKVSQKEADDPFVFERAQYVDLLMKQSLKSLTLQPREQL
jgi:dihydroorotate dehydrogenase (fumarate)